MKIYEIIKLKVPFSLALLIIVATATFTEQILLQGIKETNKAYNSVVFISLMPKQYGVNFWPNGIKEKVALTNTNIPLIPEAKRLTFDNNYVVRYRVNAPAVAVANFYRQILANQGWKATTKISSNNSDRLTIALAENPLSKKTDITYTYAPINANQVLGVKIAEANLSVPATTEQPPMQPQQPTTDQFQPGQPMTADGQIQPTQPINQPSINQMEFSRPMQPISGDQGVNQTCRVNGVDMPGSCKQYNNQGPTNQGGQVGQPDQQGPSEEEIKKMDERRFQDMKKGLSQFANGAKSMKKNLARIKIAISKCGVNLPEELINALAQTDSLIGKINSAKTAEELDEVVGDVEDVGSVMQDWGPRMGDLSRLCQILKQADRDAKQFDRNVKRMESQAKANKKIDLSELIAEYKTSVNAQKDTLTQVKALAKTDPDEALAKIEDDFYGNMDNLGNLQMQIDAIVNISKGLKNITRELNTFASQIKTLIKKKVDATNMQELLNSLKAQAAEVKNLVNSKADPEELILKVEEMFDTRQELQDALQEYDMIKMTPRVNSGNNYNVKVNLPDAFKKNMNADENGDQGFNQGQNNSGAAGSGSGASTGLGL